ncbi:MAG: type III-B CRISPR module RAMP protein Cmr4 [Deltaproteobacteria bacterium]|nr:type III-B CRISPR module RAMP protein Cmr4 [Deltaproteobacteria bacterium]
MYKQENSKIMSLYAISPVHAGAGSSMGVVDLPVQRERHTSWPHIQASGVKGSMRHHFEKFKSVLTQPEMKNQLDQITEKIFGSENYGDNGTLPGAVSVSDAKLLAFPMRSSKSPFVCITCPAILKRLGNDLILTGKSEKMTIPSVAEDEAIIISGNIEPGEKILLEDYEVKIVFGENLEISETAKKMLEKAETLLLVSDSIFNYGVENCMEIRTQIKIDDKTGTTVDGSLRYEELLPSDSLMYVILFYGASRDTENAIQAEQLISYMKDEVIKSHIQIGGDETLGCGLFQIEWI